MTCTLSTMMGRPDPWGAFLELVEDTLRSRITKIAVGWVVVRMILAQGALASGSHVDPSTVFLLDLVDNGLIVVAGGRMMWGLATQKEGEG